jgi:hypothetical protein
VAFAIACLEALLGLSRINAGRLRSALALKIPAILIAVLIDWLQFFNFIAFLSSK